ncbi:MAG: MFS transporter [Bdellovibrionota bacterium]
MNGAPAAGAEGPVPISLEEAPFLAGRFAFLTLAHFLYFLSFALFFLLPRFVVHVGGSEDDIGFLMSAGGLASLAFIPLTGSLVDRWGRKPFILAGGLLMAIANWSFLAVSHAGPFLYFLRILQGSAFALAFTASGTFAADLLGPSRRTWGFGIFGAATLLTHALGPPLAEWLIQNAGYPGLFHTAGGLALLALVLASFLEESAIEPAPADALPTPGILEILGKSTIRNPVILNFASGIGFGSLVIFLPTYTDYLALPGVAPFFLTYSLVAVALRVGGGGLPDRLGKERFAVPCASLFCLSVFGASAITSTAHLVALGIVVGLSHGFLYPVLNAIVVERVSDPRATGRAMSLFIAAFNAGVTLSSPVLGLLAEHLGYRLMYLASGALVLAGALAYVLGERREAR